MTHVNQVVPVSSSDTVSPFSNDSKADRITKEVLESLDGGEGGAEQNPRAKKLLTRAVPATLVLDDSPQSIWSDGGWGTGGNETFALSAPVDRPLAFLSHSWRDTAANKTAALLMHIKIPVMQRYQVIIYCTAVLVGYVQPWLLLPLGLSQMFVPLLVLNDKGLTLQYMNVKGPQLWLDKSCIHQGNQTLKMAGIGLFDHILTQSREIWVLFSDDYFERIWCVYELAFWIHNKGPQTIVLLPLNWSMRAYQDQKQFWPFLFFTGTGWFCALMGLLWGASVATAKYEENLRNMVRVIILILVMIGSFVFVVGWYYTVTASTKKNSYAQMKKVSDQIRNFDVKKCKASVASDIDLVTGFIEKMFGTTDRFNEVVVSSSSGSLSPLNSPDPSSSSEPVHLDRNVDHFLSHCSQQVHDQLGSTVDRAMKDFFHKQLNMIIFIFLGCWTMFVWGALFLLEYVKPLIWSTMVADVRDFVIENFGNETNSSAT